MASWQPRMPRHPDMERALSYNEDHRDRRVIAENRRNNQLRPNNIGINPQPSTFENVPLHGHPEYLVSLNGMYRTQLMSYLEVATDKEVLELVQFCGLGTKIITRNPPAPNVSTNNDPPLAGESGTTQARDNNDATSQPGTSSQTPQTINSNNTQVPTQSGKFAKRKRSKRSRKTKKPVKTTPSVVAPPPGFLAVSDCIRSKRAKNNRPNILQEQLHVNSDILINIRMFKNYDWRDDTDAETVLEGLSYSEMEFTGRHYVSDIMEHFICDKQTPNQKGVLNGFLFIKDVIYVDKNQRSTVYVDSIRTCVEAHDLGTYAKKDMHTCRLEELDFKLGQTDLFNHGTGCEHILVFTQVRLLKPEDPNRASDYPRKLSSVEFDKETGASCFNCGKSNAKWIVSACVRVPFHIALYCEPCYKSILFDNNDQPYCKFRSLPYPEVNN